MTSIEAKIVKYIWRFDPINLLILLNFLGYELDEILFAVIIRQVHNRGW